MNTRFCLLLAVLTVTGCATPALRQSSVLLGRDAGRVVTPPQMLRTSPPVYPVSMRYAESNGDVLLCCLVDRHGQVRRVRTIEASDPAFETSAARAVSRWTFVPGSIDGEAIDMWVHIPLRFRMEGTD